MALIAGTSSKQLPGANGEPPADWVDEEVPQDIPRGRAGRPKIWALVPETVEQDGKLVETGRMVESRSRSHEMTRGSVLGKLIDDVYRLHLWELRTVLFGASRRPDLVQAAQAVATNEGKDRDTLDELVEKCKDAGGGASGAIQGSALHKLSERLDRGDDLSYLDERTAAALCKYRELIAELNIVGTEQFVVNDELQAAGSYDRLVEITVDTPIMGYNDAGDVVVVDVIPAGCRVIVDLKTNKDAARFGVVYLVQQLVYAGGLPYSHDGGRVEWQDGIRPSTRWALVMHVPIDDLDAAGLYWVDLDVAKRAAQLAIGARAMHKEARTAFVRADLAPAPSHPVVIVSSALLSMIAAAATTEELGALYTAHASVWTGEHTAAAATRVATLQAQDGPPVVDDEGQGYSLVERVWMCRDRDELAALYQANAAAWGDEENAAAAELAQRWAAAA